MDGWMDESEDRYDLDMTGYAKRIMTFADSI